MKKFMIIAGLLALSLAACGVVYKEQPKPKETQQLQQPIVLEEENVEQMQTQETDEDRTEPDADDGSNAGLDAGQQTQTDGVAASQGTVKPTSTQRPNSSQAQSNSESVNTSSWEQTEDTTDVPSAPLQTSTQTPEQEQSSAPAQEPETEPTPESTSEPMPTAEPEKPSFSVSGYVSYAKGYASSIGLSLDSSATACWDTPIRANASCAYIERDIRDRLSWYKASGYSAVWVWSSRIGDGDYNIYIGYA